MSVAEVFIHNGVDPRMVDHVYLFGLHYLDQSYHENATNTVEHSSIDDDRLGHIKRYGIPPPIHELDHWLIPNDVDTVRLLWLERQADSKNKDNKRMMDHPARRVAGSDPIPSLLSRRNYTSSVRDYWESFNVSTIPVDTVASPSVVAGLLPPFPEDEMPQGPSFAITASSSSSHMDVDA